MALPFNFLTQQRSAQMHVMESGQASRRTFAWLFPAKTCFVGKDGEARFRIRGSGTSRPCEDAETTQAVVAFLESAGIAIERSGTSGICAADSFTLNADFLDGGLWAETGNYIGYEKGAWIGGARAALFVALGLGLRVPRSLRERYALPDANLEELKAEASGQAGGPAQQPIALDQSSGIQPHARAPRD